MIKIRKHILRSLAAGVLALGVTSCCSDDLEAPASESGYSSDAQLVINLAVPESMETSDAATRAEQTPTADECRINSLRFIAFSANGTPVVNRTLLAPAEMPVADDHTATYEIGDLRQGDYKIYLVANLDSYVKDVKSESELRQIVMDLGEEHELEAGNLPMVYDPGDALLTIPEASATNPAVATLSMQFACVKVRYNLLFDNSSFSKDIFGSNGLTVKSGTAANVSTKAYLLANPSSPLTDSRSFTAAGLNYGSWTENQNNASRSDADVISVSGSGSDTPSSAAKWAYQGTLYLPERYAKESADQSRLDIQAAVTDAQGNGGKVRCAYTIPLGPSDGDSSLDLPRGAYYEVIAKIKTLGEAELDATVVKKDWMSTVISADMVHTYLTLSKTALSVTSLEDDFLTYQTDGRGDVKFECVTKLPVSGTNAAIIPVIDTANKRITFRPNPEITISTLPEAQRKGTAECYITAGNIRKQVKVAYDITPFFQITPVDLKIQWGTTYDAGLNVKVYEYRTNMGGIDIVKLGTATTTAGSGTLYIGGTSKKTSYTDKVSNSQITLSCTDPSDATGQIQVKLLANPQYTTLHQFTAAPREGASGTGYSRVDLSETLSVTTMPPLGPYRIYFRAVNDWVHYNGGSSISDFLYGDYSRYPAEDYGSYTSNATTSNNWCDWWHADDYKGIWDVDHRIYIYTQIGETTSAGGTPSAWLFTGDYRTSGTHMTGDNSNPGWYYYDLAQNCVSSANQGSTKTPEPGKTLMIFYSLHDENGAGYEPHRASHHLDPGIPLFDFEDREGYVLYDPTAEPYYRIYDEKPYIEDVTYTVYTTSKITQWWNKYGIAANEVSFNNPTQWQMQYTIKTSDYTTTTIGGRTWYVTKIKLKAPRGDYEKAIKLKGISGTTTTVSMQYGGDIPSGSVRIYYRNDQWGDDVPRIYVYNGSTTNAAWGSTPEMKLERVAGGKKYYYYDISNSTLKNGYVIFQCNDRNAQYPGANQTGLAIGGQNKLLNASKSWVTVTSSTIPAADTQTVTSGADGVVLFGGRDFSAYGHTGYYLNGKWYGGKPQ